MSREYCHVGDKHLFKANVYASDGVTAAEPTSGTIDVYNQDDGTHLVDGAVCEAGSGYCQYNLTDTDTAGRYVAFMSVVVDANTTQTEVFTLTIREEDSS